MRTKIDFHIANTPERLLFVCRLIEKNYQQKRRIYIHAETQKEAHDLDELLWTYRDDSFLPHNLYGEGPEPAPPIQIGFGTTPEKQQDILLNLSATVPVFYTQFQRVFEIVVSSEPALQEISREHYRFYRGQGCEITTYK